MTQTVQKVKELCVRESNIVTKSIWNETCSDKCHFVMYKVFFISQDFEFLILPIRVKISAQKFSAYVMLNI